MTQNGSASTTNIKCSWRIPSDSGPSRCGLLQQLTGLCDASDFAVDTTVCRECLRWYPPSESHLNPVVASLLYNKTSEIVTAGGSATCSLAQAEKLQRRALQAIPLDYDSDPVADEVHNQTNMDIPDIAELIPRPTRRFGPAVTTWEVAVTTAPRQQDTLDDCLDSLASAGWKDARIMADGDVTIPAEWHYLPVTHRHPQIGAWPNYLLTLTELFMRNPRADAYLIVQDDVVFFRHPDVRRYVESILWPARRPGIACLFCSRGHAPPHRGWHEMQERLVWGCPAIIFSNAAMQSLLTSSDVISHRLTANGLAGNSVPISKWASATKTPVHLCAPSLVQHIGHVSSLFADVKAFSARSAAEFAGRCSMRNQSREEV